LAQGRSELEKSSIKAATDCVAEAALNNTNIVTLYRENRCRKCGGAMQEILTIAPTSRERGLVAYECRRCGHKTSVLQPAHA
jgi:DNA-directed RNA polymerase subunit RPC12/RpoP